jgi:hypothetical protein
MNEEDGPTMDKLCNVNIIPNIIIITPMTNKDLPMDFTFISYKRITSFLTGTSGSYLLKGI